MGAIYSPKKMLDLFILVELVNEGPLHGYAIANIIEEKFGWKPSLTSIYSILKQMEAESLVKVEDRIENNRIQKVYFITDKGRDVLYNMQQEFKKKMKKNVSHFFSLLEHIGCFDSKKDKKAEDLQKIFSTLRKIFLITIVAVNSSQIDYNDLQLYLNNTLSRLENFAIKNNLSIPEEFYC